MCAITLPYISFIAVSCMAYWIEILLLKNRVYSLEKYKKILTSSWDVKFMKTPIKIIAVIIKSKAFEGIIFHFLSLSDNGKFPSCGLLSVRVRGKYQAHVCVAKSRTCERLNTRGATISQHSVSAARDGTTYYVGQNVIAYYERPPLFFFSLSNDTYHVLSNVILVLN